MRLYLGWDLQTGRKWHSSPFVHSSLRLSLVAQDKGYAPVCSQRLRFRADEIPEVKEPEIDPPLWREVARGRFELPSAGDSYPIGRDPEPIRDVYMSGPQRPCYARPLHHRATKGSALARYS